ncbi:MAG: NADH:flavin oxidoreductase [Acetobacteraceae bacterium]|nr:NADH:flavin oxidoreductase [Acetobacteraceae bacterium]
MSLLFSEFRCCGLRLRNRLAMPPMATELAGPRGEVTPAHLEHYRARAEAGVGLIIVEHSFVAPEGRLSPRQLGAWDDALVPGLRELAQAIRAAGACAALQISHAGSLAQSRLTGAEPVGPSAVLHPRGKEVPRELSEVGLAGVARAFGQAARRCREAGFDAVEVHGAHGFLLSQFLSPLTNRRSDAYGGGIDRRMRFPLEVVEEVRRAVGPDYPVFYRLGADDRLPGGLALDEAVKAAVALERAGVGLLDVSGGLGGSRPEGVGPGYFLPLAAGVRAAVKVPVLNAGGLDDPEVAEAALREGKADIIGVGRALLADPGWVARARLVLGA